MSRVASESRTAGATGFAPDPEHGVAVIPTDVKRSLDSSEKLSGVLDAIPCGVVTADAEGTLTRINAAAERILGRSAVELLHRDVRTLLDESKQSILLLGRPNVRPGTTVERLTSCLDGSRRYLSGSIADLPDGGRLEVISDQTEVAHLRAQVNRLDTLAALGEMAASVAHELRNPMSGVEGFAGLLEKSLEADGPVEPAVVRRYTGLIRRGVAEVNGIITNLLLWACPEKSSLQPVSVGELMAEVRGDTARAAPNVHVELTGRCERLRVRGDRLRLKLAFVNVVRNACEAAGPGGRVHINVLVSDGKLLVTVDDTGPGISAEIGGKLFQPFATTKANGTGLGLALTRKFVELHGGDVSVATGPLGGARFSVALPAVSEGEHAR